MNEELETQDVQDDQVAQEDSTKSMDDTIRETLAQIEARGESASEEDQTESRARDEKGRFSKNEAAAENEPVPVEAQEPAPVVIPPEVQRLGLRKEEAEAFAKADEVVRNAFLRRSEDMHRGIEQYREKAESAAKYEQALAPFMQTIQQNGLEPVDAVQRLFAAEHGLRYGSDDQKAVHALQVLNSYNIDLNRVFQIASGQYQPQVMPVSQPVQQQQQPDINSMVKEAIEKQFLEQEITRFSQSPGREHFEILRPLMSSLLNEGVATGLDDAYEQALRAHPTLGKEWIAKQLSEAEQKRRDESAKRAQEAKRAAQVNVSRRGVAPPKRTVGTMEETIRAEAERLGVL